MISFFDNKSMLLWGLEIVDRLIFIDKSYLGFNFNKLFWGIFYLLFVKLVKSFKFCWNYYNILGYELMYFIKVMWNIYFLLVDMGFYIKSI